MKPSIHHCSERGELKKMFTFHMLQTSAFIPLDSVFTMLDDKKSTIYLEIEVYWAFTR